MSVKKVGIIGGGFGRKVHVPAFRLDSRCEVAAICVKHFERAKKMATELEIPLFFENWRDVISSAEVDIISIAVPPLQQFEIAIEAVKNGKHVFYEKPLGCGTEKAQQLLKETESRKMRHAVNFEFQESKSWQKLYSLLKDCTIGDLKHVFLNWHVETYAHAHGLNNWKTKLEEGGGTLNLFGSHTLYYLEWLFGAIERLHSLILEDGHLLHISLLFKNGMSGLISISDNSFQGGGHRLEVYGGGGTFLLENRTKDYINGFNLFLGDKKTGEFKKMVSDTGGFAEEDGRVAAVASLVKKFIDSIESGQDIAPNLHHGCRVEFLLESVRTSANELRWKQV